MTKNKLLIATRNKGKLPEIISKLNGLDLEILNLNDIEALPKDYEVEEPAMTFEGNAIIKATTIGNKTGLLTLADDSGLEVDALDGRPGVYSVRYAPGSDRDRLNKLLGELKNVPDSEKGAQFRCIIAIYDPLRSKIRTCEGIYRGRLIAKPRGENGFGYDPIFYNENLGKTNAQMHMKEKNNLSHRGLALEKACEILKNDFL